MTEQRCPKCQAPCINGTEYCVCGYKWLNVFEQFVSDLGIDNILKDLGNDPQKAKNRD